MLDFAIATWTLCAFVPGILLALALAPGLSSRLAVALAIVDLWLLLEILEVVLDPSYAFGSQALPRLVASTVQVGFAVVLFKSWKRLEARPSAA